MVSIVLDGMGPWASTPIEAQHCKNMIMDRVSGTSGLDDANWSAQDLN